MFIVHSGQKEAPCGVAGVVRADAARSRGPAQQPRARSAASSGCLGRAPLTPVASGAPRPHAAPWKYGQPDRRGRSRPLPLGGPAAQARRLRREAAARRGPAPPVGVAAPRAGPRPLAPPPAPGAGPQHVPGARGWRGGAGQERRRQREVRGTATARHPPLSSLPLRFRHLRAMTSAPGGAAGKPEVERQRQRVGLGRRAGVGSAARAALGVPSGCL